MKETTKCYCGHTTTCDCGPEEPIKKSLLIDEIGHWSFPKQVRYSEEEAIQLLIKFNQEIIEVEDVRGWFEQFKKK